MKLISIGLSNGVDDIKAKLQRDCIKLAQQGIRVVVDETGKGHYVFLGCNIVEGELSFRNYERIKCLLREYVVKILVDFVIYHEEESIIRKIISSQYYYLSAEEQESVYQGVLQDEAYADADFTERYDLVFNKLREFFSNNYELVLEGFINFRLKDYREQLTQLVEKVADDYMTELEYREFIRVLRYFVDIQKPKVEEVHVILRADGSFTITDSAGKLINHNYLDGLPTTHYDGVNHEDLLVTALITIAPHTIMLHSGGNAGNVEVIDTIQSVFDSRVVLCSGCEICNAEYLGITSPHRQS